MYPALTKLLIVVASSSHLLIGGDTGGGDVVSDGGTGGGVLGGGAGDRAVFCGTGGGTPTLGGGAPQLGQAVANVLTCLPHSEHGIRAIWGTGFRSQILENLYPITRHSALHLVPPFKSSEGCPTEDKACVAQLRRLIIV